MALSAKEYRSPTALATYGGLIAGIYSLTSHKVEMLCYSLSFIGIVLLLTVISRQQRYSQVKESFLREKETRKKLFKVWHSLSHEFRDYTDFVRASMTPQEAGEQAAKMFEHSLNHCSTIFHELTGRDCVASIMFPTLGDLKLLRTSYYSHTVQAERKSHPRACL